MPKIKPIIPLERPKILAIVDELVRMAMSGKGSRSTLLVLAAELAQIEQRLYRKKAVRKTRPTSRPMTPELAEEIRHYAQADTRASNQTMGDRFRVNTGRVSESLNGLR